MSRLRLARATESDLAFITQTERHEGYDAFVSRWDEAQHRAALADPRHAYFVGYVGAEPVGFAILRDWNAPDRVTLLKRIAVADPDHGHGRRLLHAVVEAVYRDTDAYRLWLGVFPGNVRARRAYEAVGFVAEGIARGNAFFGGVHRDELIMSMLRVEWAPG